MNTLVRCCTDNLLINAAISFIAGAGAAFCFSALPAEQPQLIFAGSLLLILAILALCPWRQLRPLATLPFFFLIGFIHTHLALQPITDPGHIAGIISEPTKVTLTGRIITMAENNGERTRFELDCESLLHHDNTQQSKFQPVHGKMLLSVQGSLGPQFLPGKKIMAMATVDRIRSYQTPGAFDFRLQMAAHSIFCSGWIQSSREILLVEEPARPAWRNLLFLPEQIRQKTADFLDTHFDREVAGLYQALLIGSTVNVSPQLIEAFKENGCFHVLSISGLHLSLLGLFSVGLFTFLLKRSTWLLLHTHVPTLALVLTAPILLLYAFIAGFNIPAIRALATALLVLFAVVLRRQRSLVHLIAAAALIVLAFTPLALFTASFQLSFAAVLAINLVYPRLPLVIAADASAPQKNHLPTKALQAVQSMLYVSVAATLGTLPILLYHFNTFSLIGPIMNLFIEPLLCLWSLPCGLLAIPLIPILPDLAHFFFQLGRPGIHLTVWLAEAVAGFPYAAIWAITPTFTEIALFFLILFLVLRAQRTGRQLVLAFGLLLLLTGSFTHSLWRPDKNRLLSVSFLDVGQGTATLMQMPDGANILLDGGGYKSEKFDPGQSLIAPFLWRNRIWRLDDLIITHPHQDHYNGLPFVAAHFRPHRLIVNGDLGEEPAYGQLLQAVGKMGVTIQTARAGDILRQNHDLTLQCVGMDGLPGNSTSWSANDRSLVLQLRYGQRSFLFPADITLAAESRLVQHQGSLRSDVLLAPHHGSRSSSGKQFLDAVSPALIIVSAGQRRQRLFPAQEHLVRWRELDILTLLTAQGGTVTCRTDGRFLRTSTFNGHNYLLDPSSRTFILKRDLKDQ
jgi:competence protein ComEC